MNEGQSEKQLTVGQLIDKLTEQFTSADLFFGHGTAEPRDEAAALVFHVAGLDHALGGDAYGESIAPEALAKAREIAGRRVESRAPLAYLLGEAWFAGLPFFVDERVLVPRSPIAELIAQHFEPWVNAAQVGAVLEIGTGSGCIAIACALAFPEAAVVATDISTDALAVAKINAERHSVAERVEFVETDLMGGINGSFDVIISNPPYVPDAERHVLPTEYGHEPELGLYSGEDGLDSARRILQDAPKLLSRHGILVLEVGAQWQALEQAFPTIPFMWLEFEFGGEGVALVQASDL